MQDILYTKTAETDPTHNLALEEAMMEHLPGGAVLLYLWQNQNTVVIGRHQNPWVECRIEQLESEGGRLVRRTSGGGAVFHDLGNLNFSFIVDRSRYDISKQLSVVLDAVRQFGIHAEFSGRNDLVIDGKKFSGNAFAFRERVALHHGTLLLDVDMTKLSRYLQVSQEKIESKGIQSVRSRVTNLTDYSATITVDAMQAALISAFGCVYGAEPLFVPHGHLVPATAFSPLWDKHKSWEWRFGNTPSFDITWSTRFEWGGIQLLINARDGRIQDAACYSDAMDEAFIGQIPILLRNLPFRKEAIASSFQALNTPQAKDIAAWITQKEF